MNLSSEPRENIAAARRCCRSRGVSLQGVPLSQHVFVAFALLSCIGFVHSARAPEVFAASWRVLCLHWVFRTRTPQARMLRA